MDHYHAPLVLYHQVMNGTTDGLDSWVSGQEYWRPFCVTERNVLEELIYHTLDIQNLTLTQ